MATAALAMVVATPAAAQRTGTRIGKNVTQESVGELTRIMAECLVDRRPQMIRTWLNVLPGTDAELKLMKNQEPEMAICVEDDQLVFAGDQQIVYEAHQFRYPIALAAIRRELRRSSATPTGLSPDSIAWFAAPAAALPKDSKVSHNALILQDFGHCVASTNWAASRALVLSEEGTPEEKAAVAALVPALGPCLIKDAKIKLTPQSVRTALAEPMFHLVSTVGK